MPRPLAPTLGDTSGNPRGALPAREVFKWGYKPHSSMSCVRNDVKNRRDDVPMYVASPKKRAQSPGRSV